MEEPVLVHVGQAKHCLIHNAFDLLLGKRSASILHQLVNVLLHELEDKVQVVVDANDFFELDDLRMVQLAERLNLSQCHALFPRIELLFHFFDGHLLLGLDVDGLDDGAVGSIAESLRNLVPLHLN